MDYLKEFEGVCDIYFRGKGIKVENLPTNSQKKSAFERDLKMMREKTETYLTKELNKLADLARENGYSEIFKPGANLLRDKLREFEYEQKDKSGLY